MAKNYFIIFLSFVTFQSSRGQMYDIFHGYPPLMPKFPSTKISDFMVHPQDMRFLKEHNQQMRDRTLSSISQELESIIRTTSQLHSGNFHTTPTPIRRTTNKNYSNHIANIPNNQNTESNASSASRKELYADNKRRHNDYENNLSGEYNAKTTTKLDFNTVNARPSFASTRPTFGSVAPTFASSQTRPNLGNVAADFDLTRPKFVTTAPNAASTRPNFDSSRPYAVTKNTYSTHKVNSVSSHYTTPSTIRPGVKEANVDTNQPPITNRPPNDGYLKEDPIKLHDDDKANSPEVIIGPDEDKFSEDQKRRYEEMVERMCDRFKSFDVKKLQAIPLVPSPEPLQVNVSTCSPSKIPLVVGGKVVTIQEFPHMALLGWTNLLGRGYSWKCGGSLISEQYVLTASHCTYQDKDDTVVSGPPRIVQLGSSYMDDHGAVLMSVGAVVRHPKYVRNRSYFDVALLKLKTRVAFSDVIRPACLGDPPGVGEPVIATGWGGTVFAGNLSLELRSVSVPVWDMEECHQLLGTSRKLPVGPSAESQICAGEKRGGKDTCQGDSGGPAQIQDGCTWRVVAVTSVGRACGAPNTPALYAIVHKAFIGAQIFGLDSAERDNPRSNTDRKANKDDTRNGNNERHDSNSHTRYEGVIDSSEDSNYKASPVTDDNHNTNGNSNNNGHSFSRGTHDDKGYNNNRNASMNTDNNQGLQQNDYRATNKNNRNRDRPGGATSSENMNSGHITRNNKPVYSDFDNKERNGDNFDNNDAHNTNLRNQNTNTNVNKQVRNQDSNSFNNKRTVEFNSNSDKNRRFHDRVNYDNLAAVGDGSRSSNEDRYSNSGEFYQNNYRRNEDRSN